MEIRRHLASNLGLPIHDVCITESSGATAILLISIRARGCFLFATRLVHLSGRQPENSLADSSGVTNCMQHWHSQGECCSGTKDSNFSNKRSAFRENGRSTGFFFPKTGSAKTI